MTPYDSGNNFDHVLMCKHFKTLSSSLHFFGFACHVSIYHAKRCICCLIPTRSCTLHTLVQPSLSVFICFRGAALLFLFNEQAAVCACYSCSLQSINFLISPINTISVTFTASVFSLQKWSWSIIKLFIRTEYLN